jgi:protein-L-isoaspartate(D-aspartate) O-methyltransferase
MVSCLTCGLLLVLPAALVWASDPFERQREAMVREQIEARGVRQPEVLRALRRVPRHLFVPPDLAAFAYRDHPLPIGAGQTISQPYIVAFMTELLDPQPHHRVLEIGTGSGYQAAVLAQLARTVYSIEIVRPLADQAAARLRSLGYRNIEVRCGDGYAGWPEQAPFDRIILTAAPLEVPPALLEQLKPGGRLVAPVGPSPRAQDLVVIDKSASGRLSRRSVLPVAFVPMVSQ